ncbi:MAG: endonuclease domain-containing protein [Chelatococcus sp.]|jgi:very-short-patch-repair endonuclease|uniref:endonuclease domain-containing protein n=1 Tax=Chelatococcus sp. TaxID=1953771 RepID=UPI0025C13058|nr:endonuclease domain-containing protein [Chelatococcus sp.]MBX3537754.1 endonuclease domain-containing protein [Chelatococcus sp.]
MRKAIVRARQLRANQTTPEEKLWHVLRHRKLNGRKFRRQHPIDRFIVDFACIEAKLVVEVDGATHSTAAETLYDRNREAILTAAGYEVLRIGNADIYESMEFVRETILAALERRGTW